MARCGGSCTMPASALKKTLFATEQDRPDVARRRRRWKAHQGRVDPARLVFIDETWAKTNMTRLCGWAPRGHKAKAVRRAIRSAGAWLFFLPPYSPDLNPIEQVFAKLKTLLRKAAERTVEATWKRIGALLQAFTPQECANYFRNAGYGSI